MCNSRLYHPLTTFGVRIHSMVSRGSAPTPLHPCLCSNVPAGLKIPLAFRHRPVVYAETGWFANYRLRFMGVLFSSAPRLRTGATMA